MKLFRLIATRITPTEIQEWRLIVWGHDEMEARQAACDGTGDDVWNDAAKVSCTKLSATSGILDIKISK